MQVAKSTTSYKRNLNLSRRMYEFKCEQNHITERFIDEMEKTVNCDRCDGTATRIISPTGIYLEPFSGVYPSAYDRWTKVRAEKLKQDTKKNAEHGS